MGLGGKRAFQKGWAADRSGAGVSLQEGETEREHPCLSLPNASLLSIPLLLFGGHCSPLGLTASLVLPKPPAPRIAVAS